MALNWDKLEGVLFKNEITEQYGFEKTGSIRRAKT